MRKDPYEILAVNRSSTNKDIKDKILDNSALVCILGLGYVGLPLAIDIAKSGYIVYGVDINEERISSLQRNESYVNDIESAQIQEQINNKMFIPSNNFDCIAFCDCIIICVPTPVDENKQPDLSYIEMAVAEIKKQKHKDMLIVLESTTYPGTTNHLIKDALETNNFKCGRDFFVAFSPERVDQGNQHFRTINTTKVVGGITKTCSQVTMLFYERIFTSVIEVSTASTAEMTKLLENTYRNINLGFINEFAMICNLMDIDVWEVIDAASTKPFGFSPFYPGPGVGGHCIPIDPYYLTWAANAFDIDLSIVEASNAVIEKMPRYIVGRIISILNSIDKPVSNSRILIIGVAYKPNISDHRESPSLKIIEILKTYNAQIDYYDPYIEKYTFLNDKNQSIENLQNIQEYDIVVILTNHDCIDYEYVASTAQLVFDTRNAIKISGSNVIKL